MTSNLPATMAAALVCMAPPSSIVHQIVSDDRALQADLAILRMKQSGELERRRDREAMRLQQRYQDASGRSL